MPHGHSAVVAALTVPEMGTILGIAIIPIMQEGEHGVLQGVEMVLGGLAEAASKLKVLQCKPGHALGLPGLPPHLWHLRPC